MITSPWLIQRKNPETGEVQPHRGVDLAYVGNKIEGIFSLYNGTVISVRPMKGYGNIILIAHDIFKTIGNKQKMLINSIENRYLFFLSQLLNFLRFRL